MTLLSLQSNQSALFLDDAWIAHHTYVWREINSPQRVRATPVLAPDRPWEGACIIARSVLFDAERRLFRLWYQSYNTARPSPENMYLCYAESSDGLNWEKPGVGRVLYRGSTRNNIVAGNLGGLEEGSGGFDCPNVVEDAADPDPERRFKLFLYGWPRGREGYLVGFSPDGIAWRMREQPVLTKAQVWDANALLVDRTLARPFVSLNRSADMYETEQRRCIYRSDSDDFENWSEPQLCFAPDLGEAPRTEYYNMSALREADVYIGLLQTLHRDARNPNDDRQSVRLAVSRDSFHWKLVEPRSDFFAPGPPGSFDEKWVYLPPPVATSPTSPLWFFYDGRSTAHQALLPAGGVGAALLRREAWCSIAAGHEVEGRLETVPFLLPPGRLSVNARTDHGGGIRAEMRRLDNGQTLTSRPLEYLAPNASPLAAFAWDEPPPAAWTGQRVTLRFHLRAAHLYGFRFVEG
jgi:hypothetical protein